MPREGRPFGCLAILGHPQGFSIDALATHADSAIVLDHRMWALLGAAIPLVRAASSSHIGVEHLLLTMLADPTKIPIAELRAMRLDPDVVFTRLAQFARCAVDISGR